MQLKTLQTSLAAVSRNKACGELRPEAIDFFFLVPKLILFGCAFVMPFLLKIYCW